jgi:hypothetical protein
MSSLPGGQQHARLNCRFLECPIVEDPGEATDEDMPNIGPTGRHQRHRGLLLALAVSWVVVPLVLGLLTSSALLGVAAFGVWMSMSGIGAGIWLSSQAESNTPVHRTPQQHSTTQTPQGWLVPSDVVRLAEPPPHDEAALFDRRRLLTALSAVVLAGCAVAVPLVFRNDADRSTEAYVFGMAFVWLVLSCGCLCSTIHNLRQGEPRPLLDRPAVLIVFLGVQCLLLLLVFVMAIPGADWTLGAWLGLLFLMGSLAATVLWLVATGERWSLSYARRTHSRQVR